MKRIVIGLRNNLGDYIRLYQEQREQLQKRYEDKDLLIEQVIREKEELQVRFAFVFPSDPRSTIFIHFRHV